MKRSVTFLISVVALLAASYDSKACGIWEYAPGEYLLYRVYDRRVGSGSPGAQVYSCEEPVSHTYVKPVPQLPESSDPQVKAYLLLARNCEALRSKYTSKWYYPTKEDNVAMATLEEVLQEALQYNGSKLKDRYALQAARAMFTLGKFDQMRRWWNEVKDGIPEGVVKDNIVGYVAGAEFRTGDKNKALAYYTKVGDVASVKYCLSKMGDDLGDISFLEYASIHLPDHPDVAPVLQRYMTRMEYYWDTFTENGDVVPFYELCMNAASNSRRPAKWYYTAAFIKNQMGQPYVASALLAKAEQFKEDDFLKGSIRVLRMLIDAQIYPYDRQYEKKLLEDLIWLDKLICDNITEDVKTNTMDGFDLKYACSYYYWNDMARKIILGTVVPRMREAGKAPLALLLANYADNRLTSLVNEVTVGYFWDDTQQSIPLETYRKEGKYGNIWDYSNPYFRLMDCIHISNLVSYAALLEAPQTELECFLHERTYKDKDFLYEVIGTRYLRECRYADAVYYLSRVAPDYQKRLNTKPYMNRLPFSYEEAEGEIAPNYKLDFAKKMLQLSRRIKASSDSDVVGKSMVEMGIGMRSSFTFCWALTNYSRSCYAPWYESEQTIRILKEAENMIQQGLDTIHDPELAAECHRSVFRWKTAVMKFPQTAVAKEIRQGCDNLVDYKVKYPEPDPEWQNEIKIFTW